MDYSGRRDGGEGQRATTLELFYDLVFVFAITQVSHLLLEHLTWAGVGQSLLVLLVVWWSSKPLTSARLGPTARRIAEERSSRNVGLRGFSEVRNR